MINTKIISLKTGLAKLSILLFVLLYGHNVLALDQMTSVSSEYSLGMQAYMASDFEGAQIHWLEAAKKSDAKSMFNLGLLHEQSKISGADMEKAVIWYRLAGKHGYAAADFHLAKLKMTNGSVADSGSQDVLALLERAADAGFAPARDLYADLTGDTSMQAVSNGSQGGIALLSKRQDYLTEDWIATKQASNWTIQILAFKDEKKVHEFIDRHNLKDVASYFIETSQSGVLYKLIYGSYQSKQEAETARDNLSKELKEHGPWLRTIASVQALITAN